MTAAPASAPLLLTPGPLTTSRAVKEAMLQDWGSRDPRFIALTAAIRARLPALAGAEDSHVCVPLQGSGTFAVEAMLNTLVPRAGKVLVLVNGAYGERMRRQCVRMGRACVTYETAEDTPPDPAAVAAWLAADPAITNVAAVHCETTTGILNPIQAIAEAVARHGRSLLIDAMSSFGALPLDARTVPFTALAASANKCLQGVPGMGFVLCEKQALAAAVDNATSLSLDLHDQAAGFDANGQWRFTPPTQIVAALAAALDELDAEGGIAGRYRRYAETCRVLRDGMQALGFVPLLPEALQAPIIVTFHLPAHPGFVFDRFYDGLSAKGFVIYPGKLTRAPSFRIGCIGALDASDMRRALAAIGRQLAEMEVAL